MRKCMRLLFFPRILRRFLSKLNKTKFLIILSIVFLVFLVLNRKDERVFIQIKNNAISINQEMKDDVIIEIVPSTSSKKLDFKYKPKKSISLFDDYNDAIDEATVGISISTSSKKKISKNDRKESKNVFDDSYCPVHPPELIGNLTINTKLRPTFEEIELEAGTDLKKGGCYIPPCKPRQKVAVIIPFKNRDMHLKTLLYYLHPVLMRQKVQYCIYVIEQFDNGQFNKAMIMNAGFKEVLMLDAYDCIVFHDVDMILESDENFYKCGKNPRHLSPAIDKFHYKPHYGTDFGGVTAITPRQYKKANGHSNRFWGWGGEDNDMEFRIKRKGMEIIPAPMDKGRYQMIRHRVSWQFKKSSLRFSLNETREARADVDGLSDIRYRMVKREYFPTYTKIYIDIRRMEVKKITLYIDNVKALEFETKIGECRWDLYKKKYLDFNIPVSFKDAEKVVNLQPGETFEIEPPLPTEKHNKSSSTRRKTPIRQALIQNFEDAKKICQALTPECRGIMHEPRRNRYHLRQSGVPRNYVILAGTHDEPDKIGYIFPERDSYTRFCPGSPDYIQAYNKSLIVESEDGLPHGWHMYKFEIELSVLLPTDKRLYYHGSPFFEAQLRHPTNTGRLVPKHPQEHSDFGNSGSKKSFKFVSTEFSLPNMPGSYIMESKITGKGHFPYFSWNWWFEITTKDRKLDAKMRDQFWEARKKELSDQADDMNKRAAAKRNIINPNSQNNKELFEKPKKISNLVISNDPDYGQAKLPMGFNSLVVQMMPAKKSHYHPPNPPPKSKRKG